MVSQKGVEKRRFQRLDMPVDVLVHVKPGHETLEELPPLRIKCRNISLEGICLETSQISIGNINFLSGRPGARENLLDIAIVLEPDASEFRARGEVCWYDVNREDSEFSYQVGIVFTEMTGQARELLKQFIKNHCQAEGLLKKIMSFLSPADSSPPKSIC